MAAGKAARARGFNPAQRVIGVIPQGAAETRGGAGTHGQAAEAGHGMVSFCRQP
jgi:hypothetical protein